jgi:segregation and condensation protein B
MSRANAARLDRDLSDLPEGMRWREWMLRAEAAIFAAPKPVARETLAGLVGDGCRLDALIADINDELNTPAPPGPVASNAGRWIGRQRGKHNAGRSSSRKWASGISFGSTLEAMARVTEGLMSVPERAQRSKPAP